MYSTLSSGDIGTLYSARNFLRAYDVSKEPLKNVNAANELLDKYTDMLIVTAALQFFGMESLECEPVKHKFDFLKMDPKSFITEIIDECLDMFVIHNGPELANPVMLSCHHCSKSYKTTQGLKNHIRSKHSDQQTETPTTTQDQDAVFNYSCGALSLCLIARDFSDARKHGDGERIIRLYKFLMLYFKLAGKTKYAYYSLHLLAQTHCLLSPRLSHQLIWNRFVNISGAVNSNIEMDREMEFHNRVLKDECRGFRGKVTVSSVHRLGRAAQSIEEILKITDKEGGVKSTSGKHTRKDTKNDVLALIEHVHREKFFKEQPQRAHFAYPDFPKNPLSRLDLSSFQNWLKTRLNFISKKKIYQTLQH